jgi:hypothetical protein
MAIRIAHRHRSGAHLLFDEALCAPDLPTELGPPKIGQIGVRERMIGDLVASAIEPAHVLEAELPGLVSTPGGHAIGRDHVECFQHREGVRIAVASEVVDADDEALPPDGLPTTQLPGQLLGGDRSPALTVELAQLMLEAFG